MSFDFIKRLIDSAEQYADRYPESTDMHQFAAWLQAQSAAELASAQKQPVSAFDETTESVIVKLLVFMNRYAKGYIKKGLKDTGIGSVDEFAFMAYLLDHEQATKSELIESARLEKPTGMEIIRRLLQMGYVIQEDHEVDKRSKNLRLTQEGKQVLFKSFEKLDQVVHLTTGDLDEGEKLQLLSLLQRLEDFHYPLRLSQRNASWEDMNSK